MQIEYSPLKAWPIGITGEAVVIFAVSDTPGLTNRKITIIDSAGNKVVFCNRAASELLFAMAKAERLWSESLDESL